MAEFVDEASTTITVTEDVEPPPPSPCSGTLSFSASYGLDGSDVTYGVTLADFEGDTTLSITSYGFIPGPDGAPGTIDPNDPGFIATPPIAVTLPAEVVSLSDIAVTTRVFKFTIAGDICGVYGPVFLWLDPNLDGEVWTCNAYISTDPDALVWQSVPTGPSDTIVVPGDCTDCAETCVVNTWEFSDASWYGCGPPPVVFTSPVCIPGAQLGSGENTRVLLVSRGAERILAELNPISGYFERKLNDTSALKLVGSSSGFLGEACCAEWADVAPWATEIIVFRDGRDAWSGPVTEAKFGYGTVEIDAADLTAWYDRRLVPDMQITDECLGFIFRQLHNAAMAPAPIPNFDVMDCTHPIKTARTYKAADYRYVMDEITELGKSGFDWTAYSRVVVTGDGEMDLKPYIRFTDDFWSVPPTVRARGNEQATVVVVKGKGLAGTATATQDYLDYYGYLVRVFDEPELDNLDSLQRQAENQLALLKDPIYIETPSGASLKSTAPVTLEELIPGIRVRVDAQATCRPVAQDFRLVSVKADFGGSVSVELEPLGAIDSRNNS